MLLVFIVFYAVMSVATPRFNTTSNVLSVLSQMAVMAILAIGQTFVIVSGGIDLSVGMLVGLSGMLGGMYMSTTGNLLVGTAAPAILTSRSDDFEIKINSIALAAVIADAVVR